MKNRKTNCVQNTRRLIFYQEIGMKWDVDIQYYLKSPVDGREFLSKAKLRRCKNRRRPIEGPFFTHISNENLISGITICGNVNCSICNLHHKKEISRAGMHVDLHFDTFDNSMVQE